MSDYFGQSPDGYQKPLYSASNLSDVPNKPLALTNLGAASADDVLKAANPIGTIIAYYGSVAPYGYLPCNGQTVSSSTFPSLVTFLGGTTSAILPDLRGEFLRGWDNGRGIDAGRAIGTAQAGSGLRNVASNSSSGTSGTIWTNTQFDSLSSTTYNQSVTGASTTSVQTGVVRPRNISVMFCIKAYDSPVSAGILNVAQLASDLTSEVALKTSLSEFVGTNQALSTTGHQKIPGGMIIQWGRGVIPANAASATFTYSTAFPNSALTGFAGLSNGTTPAYYVDGNPHASASSIIVRPSAVNAASIAVAYIVIGY